MPAPGSATSMRSPLRPRLRPRIPMRPSPGMQVGSNHMCDRLPRSFAHSIWPSARSRVPPPGLISGPDCGPPSRPSICMESGGPSAPKMRQLPRPCAACSLSSCQRLTASAPTRPCRVPPTLPRCSTAPWPQGAAGTVRNRPGFMSGPSRAVEPSCSTRSFSLAPARTYYHRFGVSSHSCPMLPDSSFAGIPTTCRLHPKLRVSWRAMSAPSLGLPAPA